MDLAYGQDRENKLAAIFDTDKFKVEVKTERDWWYKTGNIAIEIECRGKPSGLYATEADYWVHILHKDGKDYCKLFFDVPTLKEIAFKYVDNTKMIGDNFASKCILIPLKELFDVKERVKL